MLISIWSRRLDDETVADLVLERDGKSLELVDRSLGLRFSAVSGRCLEGDSADLLPIAAFPVTRAWAEQSLPDVEIVGRPRRAGRNP